MNFLTTKNFGACALFLFLFSAINGQNRNDMVVHLNDSAKTLSVQQTYTYQNTSKDTLEVLYFYDWSHAYSDKKTPLAQRLAEEFRKSMHLAKKSERGFTVIEKIVGNGSQSLLWQRQPAQDIVQITLEQPLAPKESTQIYLSYTVQLPPDKYTPFGYDTKGNYYLKDWYLTPTVYDGKWHLYSNKNLEDQFVEPCQTNLTFKYPPHLHLATNFKIDEQNSNLLIGTGQKSAEIILTQHKNFEKHLVNNTTFVTDINSNRYPEISKSISIERISRFLNERLGTYPHDHILVSTIDYQKNPLYGINQLPSFIRPYSEQFQFELKFLKTALNSYLQETLFLDHRKEKWIHNAILNYLMIDYVNTYYPDQPLLGKLSKIWGFRKYKLARMDFNDQYPFLYMLSARKNWGQPLTSSNDSLIKFNQKISNRYKAGLGLDFVADYVGKENIDLAITEYLQRFKLKRTNVNDFQKVLEEQSEKDIEWFFEEYAQSNRKIDFTIDKVFKGKDSVSVIVKNNSGTNVPVSLFGIKDDSVVYKRWLNNIEDKGLFTIPKNDADRLVLNYDQKIPEFNQRNNWKTLNGFFSGNKKLKLQFFKDAEDPYYNQFFYVPVGTFNLYDGITPGMRLYNKTLLERPFVFDIAPSYSFKERTMVGYGKISYQKYHAKSGFYVSNYALRGSSFHFNTNSRYSTITPSLSFGWRPENLRSNKRKFMYFRHVNVFRDADENYVDITNQEPDYSVFNARFINTNPGIINYFQWYLDAQHSSEFSKMSFNLEYRRLCINNTQWNLRLFAGKFIRNKTNNDYYSFALDRPTDYLFDYDYLGRSEDSGIYSQQIIIAEGGFKSKLDNPLANDWMATANLSVNAYRWIELYGDAGFVKSKGIPERFVYDTGVRLNLVTDYFELYFPVYSNNGWEIAQPDYGEKIRFIVTISPKTLTGLFTRKWF